MKYFILMLFIISLIVIYAYEPPVSYSTVHYGHKYIIQDTTKKEKCDSLNFCW